MGLVPLEVCRAGVVAGGQLLRAHHEEVHRAVGALLAQVTDHRVEGCLVADVADAEHTEAPHPAAGRGGPGHVARPFGVGNAVSTGRAPGADRWIAREPNRLTGSVTERTAIQSRRCR